VTWYFAALRKYAIFNGRSRRTEFWMFALINLLIVIGLGVVDFIYETPRLALIYGFAVLIPSLSVTVRRLHDTDRSGRWILISLVPVAGWLSLLFFVGLEGRVRILSGLIPVIGSLVLVCFMGQEGKSERNQYGPDPKRLNVYV